MKSSGEDEFDDLLSALDVKWNVMNLTLTYSF